MKENNTRLRGWLVSRGVTNRSIAVALGLSDAIVSITIRGGKKNRKVLSYLRDVLKVPVNLLNLPKDMQTEGGVV